MKPENYDWDFFLAHAGGDRKAAEALFDLLDPNSKVFLDSRRLLPGDDWDHELALAQSKSLVTIVLVSSRTEKAYYQREEIAAAIEMARTDKNKHRVVPVYLGNHTAAKINVPYGLRLKHGLSISGPNGYSKAAQSLLKLLTELKQKPAGTRKRLTGRASAMHNDAPRRSQATEQQKTKLVAQMSSIDSAIALKAAHQMRGRGWLTDGSLRGAYLSGANLKEAYLSDADLERADLRGANLEGAPLRGANLREARLEEAILKGAKLKGAILEGAYLSDANLEGADLSDANLKNADLSNSNLKGTVVSDAQLSRAKALRLATLDEGRYSGYLNLEGDIKLARESGIDISDSGEMAAWYQVYLKDYVANHNWAVIQLPRRESVKVREGHLLALSDKEGTAVITFKDEGSTYSDLKEGGVKTRNQVSYRWRYQRKGSYPEKAGEGILYEEAEHFSNGQRRSTKAISFVRIETLLVNWSLASRSISAPPEEWVYYNFDTTEAKVIADADFDTFDLSSIHANSQQQERSKTLSAKKGGAGRKAKESKVKT